MLKITSAGNLEPPIHLTNMPMVMGGSRSTWREPMHASSAQKGPDWDSNQEPCYCEAAALTTVPPWESALHFHGNLGYLFVNFGEFEWEYRGRGYTLTFQKTCLDVWKFLNLTSQMDV